MNSEIVDRIESNDEWIQQRTGIQSRRFAGAEESVVIWRVGLRSLQLSEQE